MVVPQLIKKAAKKPNASNIKKYRFFLYCTVYYYIKMKKNYITAFIILIFTSLIFSSCRNFPKYARYDISNYVSYMEAPPGYTLGQIFPRSSEFKPLSKKQMKNLNKLLTKDENYIWLKMQFTIPDELKGKEIGLHIGYIRGADLLWLNNTGIRQYGEFPPNQNSAGFNGQYFMFSDAQLNKNSINTILIKVWPDAFASISSKIFISEKPDIFTVSESRTFFNSKITLVFSGVMMVIFFMYMFLYFVMKNYENRNVYLFFALLNFYTVHFLIPFFISEVSWAKPTWLSYNLMIKFFFYGGGFTTIFFANSFIISYIHKKDTRPIIIARLILFLVPMIWAFSLKTTKQLNAFMPNIIFFGILQFSFSIPRFIKSIIDKKSRRNSLFLIIGFSPVITGIIIDMILKVGNVSPNLPFFTIYGWQVTICIFLGSLLMRFGYMYMRNTELNTKLSEFNSQLEDVVALRTKELSEANFVLSKGLETVAHVQKNFLPQKNKTFRGWDLAISYTALDNNVSGDLYDYYFTGSILDGLGIFDVSGHGIPAGLMTILAKGIISQHFITGRDQAEPLSDVLVDINKSYIKEKVNVENYITGLLFRFSEFNAKDVCSVEFANAGHPYPLMYVAEENEVKELKPKDEKQYGILGIEGLDVSFPPINVRASKDDIFVCFTDGLTEAMDKNGKEFSKDQIISLLKKYHNETPNLIMNRIIDAMYKFIGKEPISDDITLIVLKRTDTKEFIEEI